MAILTRKDRAERVALKWLPKEKVEEYKTADPREYMEPYATWIRWIQSPTEERTKEMIKRRFIFESDLAL